MDEVLKYAFYFLVFSALYGILSALYKFFTAFTKRSSEVKKAVVAGAQSGLQKGLIHNEINEVEQIINGKIDKITLKIYSEKNFDDSNKLSELKNELNRFLWSKAVDRTSEVLNENQINLIARNGNDFDKFFNNNSISDDIKMEIFLKISKLRLDILQNELINYVQEKYTISI